MLQCGNSGFGGRCGGSNVHSDGGLEAFNCVGCEAMLLGMSSWSEGESKVFGPWGTDCVSGGGLEMVESVDKGGCVGGFSVVAAEAAADWQVAWCAVVSRSRE